MNTEEHLAACIAEEAGEIAQIAGKILRFGAFDENPHSAKVNIDLLQAEMIDLLAVFEMYMDYHAKVRFPYSYNHMVSAKKKKVEKYMEYAKSVGTIDAHV